MNCETTSLRRWPLLAVAGLLFLAAANCAAAPAFTLDDGRRSHLALLPLLRGHALDPTLLEGKVVVVTFFASWCPPCRAEIAHLNTLVGEFATDELVVIAVNVFEDFWDEDATRMDRFLQAAAPAFRVVEGSEATKLAFGRVARIPTVYVFDRAGRAVMGFAHASGAVKANPSLEDLRATVAAALTDV